MALPITTPNPSMYDKGVFGTLSGLIHLGNDVFFGIHNGVPTGGDGWAGPGSTIIDYANDDIYMNTGTKASPTWTKKVD